MSKLSLWGTICLACVFCALAVVGSPAETFTTLVSFNGTDGRVPRAPLVQGFNGNLFATTYLGGASDAGTVFKMSDGGKLMTLHSFCSQKSPQGLCIDGVGPLAGLVLATNGDFYGTTSQGGSNSEFNSGGTVFEITPGGKLTTLYNFCSLTNSQGDCLDGSFPNSLMLATDGNFYGTTSNGGANQEFNFGAGTVFEITPAGKLTTLYNFCSLTNSQGDCLDGLNPGNLVQATNGNFYGTTQQGGANDDGTVFEITPAGKLTTLYDFCSKASCPDGADPLAELVQATNGNFYGTTEYGGANNSGTVFEITAEGKLTTLYSFCKQPGCADGNNPSAELVQGTNGNFYGTTRAGGINNDGTIFEINYWGRLTTLHSFGGADGDEPETALLQATNGQFYGTTPDGGTSGACTVDCGTVFNLRVGLGPFVKTLPTSGKIGTTVIILGNNLTTATSVTFNGTPATFAASSSEIKTNVPSGATTGRVKVTTPCRTLTSNMNFRVS